MNSYKICSLGLLLSLYSSGVLSEESIWANQSVTDLLVTHIITSEAGRFNLENAADIATSARTGYIYLSIPGDLAVTRSFAGVAVFEPDPFGKWQYQTTINKNMDGENQLQEPYGLKLADNSQLMIVCDSGQNKVIFLKNQNPADSSGWQTEKALDTAGGSALASPWQLALNEDSHALYVISDQAREWYYWQCSEDYKDCDGYRVPVSGILSSIDSGGKDQPDVVVGDRENNQLTVYRHQPDTKAMTIIQVIKSIPSLNYPAAVVLLDQGRTLMVTARDSNSLLIFTRAQEDEFSLQQMFGPNPVNAEELEDFVAPARLIAGPDQYDFIPVYIAAEISNSVTVLHRVRGSDNWNHHQTLENDDVLGSAGIGLLAIATEKPAYLVSVGVHSRDIVIYQISARPQFDQPEYQFDYFENADSRVGQVNISVPDGGEVIERYVDFINVAGNLTVGWQENELSVKPELPLDQYPNPIELQLTAIDQEFQNTSADVSVVIHLDPVPKDYTKYYVIGTVVVVSGTLLVTAGGAYIYHQPKKKREYSPAKAEQALGLTGFNDPEDPLPGGGGEGGGSMVAVEWLPVSTIEAQEQEPSAVETEGVAVEVEEQQQHTPQLIMTQELIMTATVAATASNVMETTIIPSPTRTTPPSERTAGRDKKSSLGKEFDNVIVQASVVEYESKLEAIKSEVVSSKAATPTRTTRGVTPTTPPVRTQD